LLSTFRRPTPGPRSSRSGGQVLVQFGQHPEQEGRIELGGLHELVGGQDIDDPFASGSGLDEIVQVKGRFAEEGVGALFLQGDQSPLDRTGACGRDVAVLGSEGRGVLARELRQGCGPAS
jgi:hypothetical protein